MYGNDENFAEADTNNDGRLTGEEVVAHHKEKVDAEKFIGWAALDLMRVTDTDKDGTLHAHELEPHVGVYKHHVHNEF